MRSEKIKPLVVDLENILICTNITLESCVLYLKKFPLGLFKLLFWRLKGFSVLSEKLSSFVMPRPELLPHNESNIEYLSTEHKKGRKIYLISNANQRVVDSIAEEINVFTDTIELDYKKSLTEKAKQNYIKEVLDGLEFEYVDDTGKDKDGFACHDSSIKHWVKALRVYQWSKNSLLFLALFMSHRLFEFDLFINSAMAFLSFSLIASSVYILNDLFDLEDDRRHPTKKERPFASGKISVKNGLLAVPLLIICGFVISSLQLPPMHTFALFAYLLATTAYSLYFKEILFVDVILLGALYTLRILAGGFATGIEVSSWLLGFSGFFFLSLAFMKRYTDLVLFKENSQEELFGRGYSINDSEFVQKAGIASAFVSLLILAHQLCPFDGVGQLVRQCIQ